VTSFSLLSTGARFDGGERVPTGYVRKTGLGVRLATAPHRLNARAVTLLSGSSVAPVYRFLLMLRNGEAADPPAFLTEQPDWQPGDVFVAANGRAFRIVDTDAEIEVAGMVLFDAIWTVEPLEESKDVISLRRG
jgi:hypothetical protein